MNSTIYYKIKVEEHQSIWDICIQEYGGMEGIWFLILDNKGVIDNLDAELSAGQILIIRFDAASATNKDVMKYYRDNQRKVNTGFGTTDDDVLTHYLLLEDSFYLLLEDDSLIELE